MIINYAPLNCEYDAIIIFDMLSDLERKSDKISEQIAKILQQNNYLSEVLNLKSKDELFEHLGNLLNNVKQGKKYTFHFVSHGNVDGIGFKHTKEFIPWKLLEAILTQINVNSSNTLVLNMTTCFGIHAIKTVNPFSSNKAFFGLIGYSGKLKTARSIEANKLYYNLIMSGFKINDAVKNIVAHFSDNNFKCITSQGYSELELSKRTKYQNFQYRRENLLKAP